MRVAILGSVALPVPPPRQGGTEWVAFHQALGLSQRGNEVTLFAARGSKLSSKAQLTSDTLPFVIVEVGGGDVFGGEKVKLDPSVTEGSRKLRLEAVYLGEVMQELILRKDSFDVVLNNMRGEAVFYPVLEHLQKPIVTVLHLPLFAELADYFRMFKAPLISISDAQRTLWKDLNYIATVYNGVDPSLFPFAPNSEGYLLMMGTIGRHKNQRDAILAAKETGQNLVLAGKIRDQDYFEELKPLIDGEQIKWVGEMGFSEKIKLYQGAKAFLFPIVWEEPFGLVMIEAMSCGVPVIAYPHGAIPEVVENGKSGFIVEDLKGMVEAIKKIDSIERTACRKRVEENFTVEKMVEGYEKALKIVISS